MKSILVMLVLLSGHVFAGEQVGNISNLYARASDNLHLVVLSGGAGKTNSPSCATRNYWLIKDEASVAGKSQFSQLLAAQMAGKKVSIIGSNTCTRWGDGEDINYIVIQE